MPESDRKPAVVLLSGGLDSTTVLAIALQQGFACHALSFDYCQRHQLEIEAAKNIAQTLKANDHKIITIDLRAFGGSALTADIDVPRARTFDDEHEGMIPVTYVPARNTIFLSLALAFAETILARDIFIGVNAIDYSGYPDCRPAFIEAFEHLANLATRAVDEKSDEPTYRVHAPLIDKTKGQIIQRGIELGVDYSETTSCYDPDPATGSPCEHCDACALRAAGFAEAGVADPLLAT